MAERTLKVRIVGDESDLERSFNRSSRSASNFDRRIGQAGRGALSASIAYRGLGRAVGFASTSFIGGAGFVFAAQRAIDAASDLNEQTSKTRVVFGQSSKDIIDWSKTTAGAMGLSQRQALATASSFGALFRPIGIAGEDSARLSQRLTTLGADLASFYNTDVQDALDAIRSGLVGESEPLRRYGVLLSETRVQQEAMNETGKKNATSLTAQEKALARITIILKDTKVAQGDFSRTSGGLANQLRILQANVDDLAASLGSKLTPGLTSAVTQINQFFADAKSGRGTDGEEVGRAFGRGVSRGLADLEDRITAGIDAIDWGEVGKHLGAGLGAAILSIDVKALAVGFVRLNVRLRVALVQFGYALGKALVEGLIRGASSLGASFLEQVLRIVKPLQDLDKFLPGSPFKGLKNKLEQAIIDMELFARDGGERVATQFSNGLARGGSSGGQALQRLLDPIEKVKKKVTEDTTGLSGEDRAKQRNTWFDAMIGRLEDRVQDIRTLQGQVKAYDRIAALISARIAKTKDITRRLNLEDELVRVQRERRSILDQIATDAKQDRDARAQAVIDALTLNLDRAKATAGLNDDLRAIRAITANLRRQLAADRTNVSLQSQLFQAEQEEKAIVQKRKDARDFIALGLSAEGDKRIPGVRALRKALASFEDSVQGTFLDTKKTRSVLSEIRRILRRGIGGVSEDVRRAIAEIFGDLNRRLKEGVGEGEITKFRKTSSAAVVAGLGLTRAQSVAVQARVAAIGPGGTVPVGGVGAFGRRVQPETTLIVIHDPVFQGVHDVRTLKDQLTREAKRSRTGQRRGPGSGRR